jgi:hypothetical protein
VIAYTVHDIAEAPRLVEAYLRRSRSDYAEGAELLGEFVEVPDVEDGAAPISEEKKPKYPLFGGMWLGSILRTNPGAFYIEMAQDYSHSSTKTVTIYLRNSEGMRIAMLAIFAGDSTGERPGTFSLPSDIYRYIPFRLDDAGRLLPSHLDQSER